MFTTELIEQNPFSKTVGFDKIVCKTRTRSGASKMQCNIYLLYRIEAMRHFMQHLSRKLQGLTFCEH